MFGAATLLSGLADQMGSLPLLYLSYGIIGGLGNGFCYVTPIATLIRWFPDKRGLVTGLAVMGFGLGAFFMGKIAPAMIIAFEGGLTASGVAQTFYIWGVIFLVLVVGAAQLFKNPLQGWLPAGFTPSAISRVRSRLLHLRRGGEDAPVVDALGHAVPERLRRSWPYLPAFSSGPGIL
ncbi:MAG: hypothetical protein MZW92_06000 [Comamonadaceae bacterium]|nr:hypothetical protein [Comamonadaceae bacterium]